jgi:fructokinase
MGSRPRGSEPLLPDRGTGVGAGLVLGGEPVRGLVHPEVGHIRIPDDQRRDRFPGACPVYGACWEGLAPGIAIERRWNCSPAKLDDDHPAWSLEAENLALGILSIVLVASPLRVVAGGGEMERAPLLPQVREKLREPDGGYLDTPMLRERLDT